MERGLRRFTGQQIADRWDEVFAWLLRVVDRWAQRRKRVKIERLGDGIRVELQTQDDLGYYEYGFDVFANRAE
jgi:hypothetical protein